MFTLAHALAQSAVWQMTHLILVHPDYWCGMQYRPLGRGTYCTVLSEGVADLYPPHGGKWRRRGNDV